MPAQLKSTVDRLGKAISQFTLVQRVFAVIAVAAVAVAGVYAVKYVTAPTMTPLYSGLSGTDASAIVDQLTSDGVSYQLSDGGATVLVPQAKVYAERIKLAAKGLPTNSDGTGYSLLDSLSATSTEFQEKTTYQRAMEGELAKTVKAMDGIASASVKLAVPESSVYTDEQKDPTASVFVREDAGKALSSSQVTAIVHLVSSAISGMQASDVSVVDADGKVLSTVGTATGSAVADQATSDYESKIESTVHSLLDPLVGANNVTVTATATLDYDSSKKTIETYSQPTPSVDPLASSTKTEEYGPGAGSGSSATGILGPDNIAVPTGSSTSGTGNGSYKSTSQDSTNAVNKTTEEVTAAPGSVERQSVSVAINSKAANAVDMTALQSAISAAAGIDASRGDTLSVQRMAFDTTAATTAKAALAAADKQAAAQQRTTLIKQASIAGVVLILLVALIALGRRRSRRARREALDLGRLEAATAERETALLPVGGGSGLPELAGSGPREPDPIEAKRAQIAALAEDQPDEVADLLRGWLAESGGRRR